ncbi:cell division protein FtsZ [Patescibacteria group bacterium]|nr:cell division protein FtsZ [Patescibacteria group bacterium]
MVIQEINPEFIPGARIKVIGVGGAGVNAVNRMIGEGIQGVEFVSVNTDAQQLANSLAPHKVNIGLNLTKGLGAGANPDIGRKAAEEDAESIKHMLKDADMVFISAGMGGGTGTGAVPVIAQIAKEMGILTVAVVTKPFSFEGKQRFINSADGLERLRNNVDTLIIIPNDKIFNIVDKKTTFKQAFSMIDKILTLGVQGITDLVIKPGLINIDFADIKRIMQSSGTALLGIGYGDGEQRAVEAARRAIDNPLLESHLAGAKNIIFAVTGGDDLTPIEVQEAARIVEEIADPEANIIWGMSIDEAYQGEVKVTIIATGFSEGNQETMIRAGSLREMAGTGGKFGGSRASGFMGATRTRSEDFVSRELNTARDNTPAQAETPKEPAQDFETPPFMRKRLMSEGK